MAKPNADKPTTPGDSSVHLFFGDEFLIKEEVRKFAADYLDDDLKDINLIVLDGNRLDTSELSSHLLTPSLFGGTRLIVVDQTPLFLGKVDRNKLLAKVIDQWNKNDRKAAFKALGQLGWAHRTAIIPPRCTS
ncbi:hypothetical protein ACFL2Q_19165, partial [Thermodesulfobacteriota bacterium]